MKHQSGFPHNFSLIRTSVFMLVVLLAVLTLLSGFRKDYRKPFKNYVLLVSLDGFRWDYNRLYNTPNLNKLAKDGVKADRMISSFPTVTFPNHYSIATGLYPDHHGLINNSFPAPDLGLFYRMDDSSWSIGTKPDGSALRGGAHGYDNSDSDMFAIFYAAGPSFKKNYSFKELNNVDVYNLICDILRITPAKNDGDPTHIKGMLR